MGRRRPAECDFVDEGEIADRLVCRDERLERKQLRTSAATLQCKWRKVTVNSYCSGPSVSSQDANTRVFCEETN